VSQPYAIHIGRQSLATLLQSSVGIVIAIIIFAIIGVSINPATGAILFVSGAWLFMVLGFVIVGILFQALSLAFLSYDVTPQTMIMRGGIIARYERNVPFSRIQHVVISQTFVQRLLGLATLKAQNADQGNIAPAQNNQSFFLANIDLPGLYVQDAQALRKEILDKVLKTKGSGVNNN
jgi:uncharacterized membrane protein YdbT with pleckstrin-like domain